MDTSLFAEWATLINLSYLVTKVMNIINQWHLLSISCDQLSHNW